jgi:hypothetical protein
MTVETEPQTIHPETIPTCAVCHVNVDVTKPHGAIRFGLLSLILCADHAATADGVYQLGALGLRAARLVKGLREAYKLGQKK